MHPTTDPEVIVKTESGIQVVRQGYEDGFIYEYMVPRGLAIDEATAHFMLPPFQGRHLSSWSDTTHTFISSWVPYDELSLPPAKMQAAIPQQGLDPDLMQGPAELLHDEFRARIERVRHHKGWIYRVSTPFGYPWPSLPAMAPTRTAPVIGLQLDGTRFLAYFWVSDVPLADPPAAEGYHPTPISGVAHT